jgi:hypothetical protein
VMAERGCRIENFVTDLVPSKIAIGKLSGQSAPL